MTKVFAWFLASKGAKIGTGVGAGGSLVALIFGLHQDIKVEINKAEYRAKEYAELQAGSVANDVGNKLDNLKEGQKELKDIVKTIDSRLYNLKTHN